MCVVTNYNQSLCSSVDDHIVTGGVLGGGVGGGYFRSLLIANRQDVLRYRCVL